MGKSPKLSNKMATSNNCKGCINMDRMFEMEYQALREEKLNRYDYANKLTTDLITFTTAVVGAALAMYAIYNKEFGSDNTVLILKYLQSLLMLSPALFATVTHRHSILNSIRINLISDYLREMSSAEKTWEKFKKEYDVQYFDFPYNKHNKRIGDITDLCIGTTAVSLLFSWMMALVASLDYIECDEYYNCYIILSIGCPLVIILIKLLWNNKTDTKHIICRILIYIFSFLVVLTPLIMCFVFSAKNATVNAEGGMWLLPCSFLSIYSILVFAISPYYKEKRAAEEKVCCNACTLKEYKKGLVDKEEKVRCNDCTLKKHNKVSLTKRINKK